MLNPRLGETTVFRLALGVRGFRPVPVATLILNNEGYRHPSMYSPLAHGASAKVSIHFRPPGQIHIRDNRDKDHLRILKPTPGAADVEKIGAKLWPRPSHNDRLIYVRMPPWERVSRLEGSTLVLDHAKILDLVEAPEWIPSRHYGKLARWRKHQSFVLADPKRRMALMGLWIGGELSLVPLPSKYAIESLRGEDLWEEIWKPLLEESKRLAKRDQKGPADRVLGHLPAAEREGILRELGAKTAEAHERVKRTLGP